MADSVVASPSSGVPTDLDSLLDTVTDPSWLCQAALSISSPRPSSSSSGYGSPPDIVLVRKALDKSWIATSSWVTLASTEEDEVEAELVDVELKDRLAARRELNRRRQRMATWDVLQASRPVDQSDADEDMDKEAPVDLDDDPWAEEMSDEDEAPPQEDVDAKLASSSTPASSSSPLPFDLPTFLTAPILHVALLLTTPSQIANLHVLVRHHALALRPHRFTILEAIPDWISPETFHQLLPQCNSTSDIESAWASDLVGGASDATEALVDDDNQPQTDGASPTQPFPLTSEQVSEWYRSRIESIETNSGLVDISLAYVQHAVSQGVPSLDVLGEDLSLLSRLVYDSRTIASSPSTSSLPLPPPKPLEDDTWTLSRWRTSTPEEATKAYLRHATPDTVVPLIQRLVLPYLFVLLSRSERTDTPDPTIPSRMIQHWLLEDGTPLELIAEVFAASKATLPEHERILRKDEEVARLALAILYGNREINRWDDMSRVFECLPAWSFGPEDHEDGEGSTTLLALGQFLRPTPTSPPPPPSELYTFFLPLGAPSLSLLLDALDVHLESAETLSRWGVPAALGWFILSAEDRAEQFAWATRMARRGGERAEANQSAGAGRGKGVAGEGWEALLRDMKKLRGGGPAGDDGVGGAFGLLEEAEIVKLFFGGLLSSGNFSLAKSMFAARPPPVDRSAMESLVLAASVEFYENAETGNLHEGDMKLAYNCLSIITPPTPLIIRERHFIEATSRLTSPPLTHLSPLSIRLSKDRLSFIAQLLSASEDAYKHPEVILDLVDKLGYEGDDGARVKALGMCCDAAVTSAGGEGGGGDWERGVELVERMVQIVGTFQPAGAGPKRRKTSAGHSRGPSIALTTDDQARLDASKVEAVELTWKTAYQLGRHPASSPAAHAKSAALVGHALTFCPPDAIADLLVAWSKIEESTPDATSASAIAAAAGASPAGHARTTSTGAGGESAEAHERKRDMAARAAARTFSSLSSSLSSFRPLAGAAGSALRSASPAGSFRSGHITMGEDDAAPKRRSFETPSVAHLFGGLGGGSEQEREELLSLNQGRRALTRGVGWLLGASETEMGGDVL